jgi:hypothetical protein
MMNAELDKIFSNILSKKLELLSHPETVSKDDFFGPFEFRDGHKIYNLRQSDHLFWGFNHPLKLKSDIIDHHQFGVTNKNTYLDDLIPGAIFTSQEPKSEKTLVINRDFYLSHSKEEIYQVISEDNYDLIIEENLIGLAEHLFSFPSNNRTLIRGVVAKDIAVNISELHHEDCFCSYGLMRFIEETGFFKENSRYNHFKSLILKKFSVLDYTKQVIGNRVFFNDKLRVDEKTKVLINKTNSIDLPFSITEEQIDEVIALLDTYVSH